MRFALAFLYAFALVCCALVFGGCGAASPVSHSSTPVTLGSVPEPAPEPDRSAELAQACDTHRARFRHTPVRLSDGTPVWCF